MSPQLLSVLLWIPFAIVALIAGLIYCIRGYKKGLWCALGSLGAVVLSTVLSVLLARLAAAAAAPAVAGYVPVNVSGDLESAVAQVMLVSGVTVVLSILLFGLMMLILTPVFSWIIGKLLGKHLITDSKTYRWLGLATGFVSALVFTLCWLSPLYGTLATAAPVAQSVMVMEETEQAKPYVDSVSNHLLVKVSGSGPVALVYDNVSRMSVGGSTVSLMEMSDAMKETFALVQQIQTAQDPAQLTQLSTQVVDLVRTYFVDQDWFYTLFRETVAQLKTVVADSASEDAQYYRDMLALADMSEDEFRSTMNTVLDFAVFALEKDVFTMAKNLSVTEIYQSGVIQELGEVFNSSDRIVELKKLTMAKLLQKDGLTYAQALALLDEYGVGKLTEEKDQMREVEALLVPIVMPKVPSAVMILRHPGLGGSALLDVQEQVGFAKLMGLSEEVASQWSADKQNALIIAMMSLAKMSFEDLANADTDLNHLVGTDDKTEQPGASAEMPGADVDVNQEEKPEKTEKPDSGLSDAEKKENIKDKMDEVGVSGAKDMLDKMDEDEKQDIKDTLDKMGVDSMEDAKNLVDKMDPDDILDIMENMGYGDLAGQLGLK